MYRYNGHAYVSKYICVSVNVSESATLPFEGFYECSDWLSVHLRQVTLQVDIIKGMTFRLNGDINVVQKEMECAVLLLCSP